MLDTCVTFFWGAWVFALILEVPDLLKVKKNEGIKSSSASNGTIVIVRLELTNMDAFIAFIDDSPPFLNHNESWRYFQETQKSKSFFNRKHN